MVCREISPVQRLRALVCMCMRMAPPLRLPKPSQRGPLHINKYKMDTICRNSASALVASTSFSLHPCHGQGGRQSRNEKNGHHSSTGALYLGPKSKRTVGKNFLSVEGSPKVLMQRRVSSSCFPRAVLTEGFATTQEAWQLLLPALLKFPIWKTQKTAPETSSNCHGNSLQSVVSNMSVYMCVRGEIWSFD